MFSRSETQHHQFGAWDINVYQLKGYTAGLILKLSRPVLTLPRQKKTFFCRVRELQEYLEFCDGIFFKLILFFFKFNVMCSKMAKSTSAMSKMSSELGDLEIWVYFLLF